MPAKFRMILHTSSTGALMVREVHTLLGWKPFQRSAPSGFTGLVLAISLASDLKFPAKTSLETIFSYFPSSPGASSKVASHSAKVWSVWVTG